MENYYNLNAKPIKLEIVYGHKQHTNIAKTKNWLQLVTHWKPNGRPPDLKRHTDFSWMSFGIKRANQYLASGKSISIRWGSGNKRQTNIWQGANWLSRNFKLSHNSNLAHKQTANYFLRIGKPMILRKSITASLITQSISSQGKLF